MNQENLYNPVAPQNGKNITLELLTIFGLVVAVVIPIIYWSELPERIPTHFNFEGEPDGWGGKGSVWILPAVTVGLYLLMKFSAWLIRKHPDKTNVKNYNEEQIRLTLKMLAWMGLELVWMFVILTYLTIQVALGLRAGLGAWPAMALVILVLATSGLFVIRLIRAK